jgi:hypothetical protein
MRVATLLLAPIAVHVPIVAADVRRRMRHRRKVHRQRKSRNQKRNLAHVSVSLSGEQAAMPALDVAVRHID